MVIIKTIAASRIRITFTHACHFDWSKRLKYYIPRRRIDSGSDRCSRSVGRLCAMQIPTFTLHTATPLRCMCIIRTHATAITLYTRIALI